MNREDVYIIDIMESIVAAVSNDITPMLQASAIEVAAIKGITDVQNITGVHYMYGHPREIVARLIALGKGDQSKYNKYPLVWLETPIKVFTDRKTPGFKTTNFKLRILNGTVSDYIAPQRVQNNFIPILRPIKNALLTKMDTYTEGRYKPLMTSDMSYADEEIDYWGKYNDDSGLLDFLDCIVLSDLTPKLTLKNC